MPYELAKELKDAGFKQYGNNRDVDGSLVTLSASKGETYDWDVYAPTLEELIEACNGNFESIHFRKRTEQPWTVFGFAYCVSGSNPAEAVAKLWLALHAKNK